MLSLPQSHWALLCQRQLVLVGGREGQAGGWGLAVSFWCWATYSLGLSGWQRGCWGTGRSSWCSFDLCSNGGFPGCLPIRAAGSGRRIFGTCGHEQMPCLSRHSLPRAPPSPATPLPELPGGSLAAAAAACSPSPTTQTPEARLEGRDVGDASIWPWCAHSSQVGVI